MKTMIFSVVMLALSCSFTFADSGEMKCEKGMCEGWEGQYETVAGSRGDGLKYEGSADYIIYNQTGKTAFNIKITINFYDYFGNFLGRLERKEDGPIDMRIPFRGPWRKGASTATFHIYWTDDYNTKPTIE